MADGTGGVLKDVDDRLACLGLDYLIRSDVEAIEEAVLEERRREFNADYVRPETIKDVQGSVETLVGNLKLVRGADGGCGLPRDTVGKWIEDLQAALNQPYDPDYSREVILRVHKGLIHEAHVSHR